MRLLASMRSFASALFRRSHLEDDMEEELRSHIEYRADDLERSGLPRAEAERRARIEFGGHERFKEECREALGTHFLAAFFQDVRYGLRTLRRSPGFTVVAILTLTIGVGVNTSVFSLIYALAIRPLPVKDASSLASVYQESRATSQHPRGIEGAPSYVSYPEYANYRDGNHVFSGLAAYAETTVSLSGTEPEFLHGLLASCNYFDVLGANLATGRSFGPSDCRAGAGSVAVLSNGFWQRRFGGDPSVVGKTLTLDRQVFAVIGITAPEFSGTELQVPDLWVPISMAPQLMPDTFATHDWLALPNVSWLHVVGHLKPGISRRQAQAELNVLAHQMDANSPGAKTTVTVNAGAFLNGPEMRAVGVWFAAGLFALAGLVLLMACVNIANLLLARATARQQEIGVRLALGANRHRLIRQLLTESVLFAIPGGLAGLIVALWLPPVLIHVLPEMPETSLPVNLAPNFPILCYSLLASLAAAVVSSFAPALHTTQPDLLTILKDDGASAGHSRSRTRLRGFFVAAQVSGCTLLLVVASLLARGLHRAQDLNPGFTTRNVFVMSFDLQQKGYDGPRASHFEHQMRDRLASLPGVAGVTSSVVLPCVTGDLSGVTIPGSKAGPGSTLVLANIVSADYFKTMEIPILQGHAFTEQEIETNGPAPAVISRAMARRFWLGEDPIGKQFSASKDQRYRVVGIAPDLENLHLGEVDGPFYYGAMNARNNGAAEAKIFVRTSGSSELLSAVPEIVRQLDPNVMVITESYEQILGKQLTPARTGALLVGILGVLAMLLAIVGVMGVVSYAASQRVREIGIRRALGAQTRDVITLLVRQNARVVAIGLVIGLALAAGSAVLLSAADLLFGVSPLDPLAFLGTTILLAAVAFFSMLIPAWRPARVDPMIALRRE
ncbi:MAG TPA: ABC transporter permease [Candidatus Angelobacter sp.]